MKSFQYKYRNGLVAFLLLALTLTGCGSDKDDDNSSSAPASSNVVTVVTCFFTLFLLCKDVPAEGNWSLTAKVPATAIVPEIKLSWDIESANPMIAGYRIYRDGTQIADTESTEYSDSSLEPDTRYCYTIAPYDESLTEAPHLEPVCATTSWHLATIASDIAAPRQALALDVLGQVHLAYLSSSESGMRNLWYTRQQADTWETEDLGPMQQDNSDELAIAVDATGAVHIGSLEHYFDDLSGTWKHQVLVGYNLSVLAIDSYGFVHAVSAGQGIGFDHSTNVGGWVAQPVGDGEWKRLALTVDSFDTVHIAYYNYAARELRYLNNRRGNWSSEVIANRIDPLWHIDMAVDASGNAHLVYRSETETAATNAMAPHTSLEYASNASGAWLRQPLDSGLGIGGMSSIAVDSGDSLHISYTGGGAGELKYLTNTTGTWQSTVIDDGLPVSDECGLAADICGATSIAVDLQGTIHIGYQSADSILLASRT